MIFIMALFSLAFLWTNQPDFWSPPPPLTAAFPIVALGALSLLCAIGARALLRHRVSWAIGLLFMATAATAGALWLDFVGWRAAGLAPQESGQGAVIFALHALQACAVGIGALMAGYCAVRPRAEARSLGDRCVSTCRSRWSRKR